MAMTIEQQRALALAKSRRRRASTEPQPGNVASPSTGMTEAMADASKRSQFTGGPVTPRAQQDKPDGPDLAGATAATLGGLVNGIPVLGPIAQNLTDAAEGGIAAVTGGDYGETVRARQARRADLAEANPIADIAGQVTANIGALGAAGATKVGGEVLGMTGKLVPRIVNSAKSGAALAAGDTAARGGSAQDVLVNGATGAAGGAIIPAVGAAIRGGVGAVGNALRPTINAVRNGTDEALRRTGIAVSKDAAVGNLSTAADEAAAKAAGIPLMNADRGGETVRALTRSVANQSPEARESITKAASDRFGSQAQRATDFIKRITGGAVDDLDYQRGIQKAATETNTPAYAKAHASPNAQQVFTPELQELMQSPTIQRAIGMVKTRAADRAAVAGQKPIVNPFRKSENDGTWRVVQKADGTLIAPNLAFWDQVKRNIDPLISRRQLAGDKTGASDLMALKEKLVGTLDELVPDYKKARRGAAAFFDAEDALDAGKKFANTPRLVPEAREAVASMSKADQQAFQTGYASELIDRIKATPDRSNVISATFKSPAARESMDLVFGKDKALQIEAYVRVEDMVDRLRGALGNSTTARQLMEMGIGAGAGGLLTEGDWKGMVGGAGLARGARWVNENANAKVMREIADMLLSDDPKVLQRAVIRAARVPAYMEALENLSKTLAAPTRAGVQLAIANN